MCGKKTVEKNRVWEKGRRDKLNQSFSELSKLLPDHDPSITLSKMEILNRAAMYIKTLQRQNQDILNDGKQTYLEGEVDRLQKRVAHLIFKTKLLVDALRNAGVPIPEVKPPKSRNRKKQVKSPVCDKNSPIPTISGDLTASLDESLAVPEGSIILANEPLKDSLKTSNNSLSCTSSSLKVLENSLKVTDEVNKSPDTLCRTKDFKLTKEPLKEINSTLPSVNIPKDISSVSQAPQPPPISVAVKEQPILNGSIPNVITSINQGQNSTLPNFTFLDRSLVNLGPGTLILADGRVVNVPPPHIPQIVVKPQPTLILMQKTVRREKRLYPKPKQVDVTRTTFSNKAPIPSIKHFNFEFKTKRSRIKVTKTRLSPKQIKKKEPVKSKVIAKTNLVKMDGEIQVEMNQTVESVKSCDIVNISEINKDVDDSLLDKTESQSNASGSASLTNLTDCTVQTQSEKNISSDKSTVGDKSDLTSNSKVVSKLVTEVSMSLTKTALSNRVLDLNEKIDKDSGERCIKENELNNSGDTQLENLNQVITMAQNCEKIPENVKNSVKNSSAIDNEVLKVFSPVASVNSIDTVVDSCIDPNQTLQNELNIPSNESFKNRSESSCILDKPIVFSKDNEVANTQNKSLTENSNKRSRHITNDNSTRNNKSPEIDTNQLSNTKNIQDQALQNVQSSSLNGLENKENGSVKEHIVPCNSESNVQNQKSGPQDNNTLHILTSNNPRPTNVSQEALKNPDCTLNCGKQFQSGPSNNLGNIQNKTTNEKSFSNKNVRQEDRGELQSSSKKVSNQPAIANEGSNTYFTNANLVPVSDKANKEYFSTQHRVDNCQTFSSNQSNGSVNKIAYNPKNSQCNNAMPVETFNPRNVAVNKDDYSCKDKRLFESNNQNLNKDTFNVMSNGSTIPNQNVSTQPFGNVTKETYATQNCRMPRSDSYTNNNCELMKETFNNPGKSPCKEMFVNYMNNPLNKSPYSEQVASSLNKDSYGSRSDIMKTYFNQAGSINHHALYGNQYNTLNNSFINQNNAVYNKESFVNQCESFNYVNQESSNKDGYSRTMTKDLYTNQNSSLNKTGYSNQNSMLNKDPCVSANNSLNKDSYREQTMPLPNQCNVLNKESYAPNKDCYVNVNKDSYSGSSANLSGSLSKESYNASVTGTPNKNLDNNQTSAINKDSMINANSGQRNNLNKPPYENPKSMTADKACQPEMPLCRNISNSEFMEVVSQSVMRGNAKDSEASSVQMRSGENRGNINELRNVRCSVNNAMYNTNQPIASFSNISEQNGPMAFDGSAQKRNKDNVYTNKNNSGIVCKYTIDSLFKNGDITGSQVNIGSEREKVQNSNPACKSHLHKRNTAPYEIEGLPIVNEPGLTHGQGQIYPNESNHYTINSRESANICGNIMNTNLRNEMTLVNNACSLGPQTDLHNNSSCKANVNNNEKNGQNNKIFNNPNSDSSFNKNDPILMASADLMKSKELDRNNFMPLLDDVRLTTDFSSDLFSTFQVAPGSQHPESMSPTAAFLLAFPLVSTSKTADNISENDNPEHNSSTPTTILQIGNIEQPNPDIFHNPVETLRSKPVDENNKDYERYAHYEGNMYENVQVDNNKRKSSQNQTFTDQSNNCVDKSFRRNCDSRKRSRNQPEIPAYSQSYAYPILPNNNDFTQFTNSVADPKSDGLSVPWTMNLNQDFSTQTVQKDVCAPTKNLKNTERKNSKNDKQQMMKSTGYSCSQQGSQTGDYYVTKPERKKQKTSHAKTPVNWMAPTEPPKNTFVEPPLSQIDVYQNKDQEGNLLSNNQSQNVYNNIVSSLEVPFDSVCFSEFGNKKSNNYSWSPSKSLLPALDNHNFVIPSTLPTLVGDLALGTSTPAETFKSFEDNRKFEQPKKADKSSSTFLDNATAVQTSVSTSNSKKRVDYNAKSQVNNNSFLSVSQLVDPKCQKQSKINEMKNMKRNESNATKEKFQNCQNINNRREQQEQNCIYNHRNEMPNNCWNDKQQKNSYKGNYSAESLIAAQPTSEMPESFHLNFNNYQAQSNYFHGDFSENNQFQQGQQYQNYFNQGASHFSTFLGEEYTHEFSSGSSQRKKKTKENTTVYPPGIHAKDSFGPLQKDNTGYLNSLQKDAGSYQASGLLGQGYRNCIKLGVTHVGQHSNTTSTLTNFNLSTIFPEINDQRVSGGASQPPHINPNFTSLPLHNYPPH